MALPHIQNSQAGRNKWDPVHTNIFEVRFTLPEVLRPQFGKDEFLLTEHVTKISGLDSINRAPSIVTQKFMGTTRSYISPILEDTSAQIEVNFTLNLRDATDNYIYKMLRAWAKLGYDQNTGARTLKREYCADWMNVVIANRAGDVFHDIIFKDVMMAESLSGYGSEMDYSSSDPAELTAKFVSDWWLESGVENV